MSTTDDTQKTDNDASDTVETSALVRTTDNQETIAAAEEAEVTQKKLKSQKKPK